MGWCYHKRPQRSQHQERTCREMGRMAKDNHAKKNTIAKSATHQRWTSTINNGWGKVYAVSGAIKIQKIK